MFSISKWALAALGVILLAAPAQAYDNLVKAGTIVVGTTGSAPPFSMVDNTGKLDGYDIALMNEVSKALDLNVEFVQLDWSGLLPGLAAHRFDVVASGVNRTAARLASKDFIMLSPDIVTGVAVAKLTSNDTIKKWNDVCGKHVGVVRGSSEIESIKSTLPDNCITNITEYPGWTEMSLDLKNHRIDWIGMDYLGLAYAAKTDPQISILHEIRAPMTQGIAVSAKEPDLAKAMDEVIAKYRGDGTLNKLVEQYFGTTVDFTNMPPDPAQ